MVELKWQATMTLKTVDMDELTKTMEALIRKVVREELEQFARENVPFYLPVDSPLYKDMEDILARKMQDKVRLYNHKEVWGE